MAVSFEHEPGASRCTIRYEGRIMPSDLTDGIRAQTDAGAWTCETLIDTRAATGIDTHYQDTMIVARTIEHLVRSRQLPPRGPVVVLVRDRGSAIHGMARMYEATTAQDARLRVEIVFSLADVNPAFERLRARV